MFFIWYIHERWSSIYNSIKSESQTKMLLVQYPAICPCACAIPRNYIIRKPWFKAGAGATATGGESAAGGDGGIVTGGRRVVEKRYRVIVGTNSRSITERFGKIHKAGRSWKIREWDQITDEGLGKCGNDIRELDEWDCSCLAAIIWLHFYYKHNLRNVVVEVNEYCRYITTVKIVKSWNIPFSKIIIMY